MTLDHALQACKTLTRTFPGMNPSFKHSPLVHLLGLGGSVFFAWLAYRSSVDPFDRGCPVFKAAFIVLCVFLAVAVLLLYLTSGANRYEITAEGLRVRRLLHTTLHPWADVRRIDLNNPLHYIVIRSGDRTIAYTSTDFFPRIIDFIRAIHEQSNCTLPPILIEILANEPKNVAY